MNTIQTVLCAYCHKEQARKPGWGSKNKPICGECFMDVVQRENPKLHDRIAESQPWYTHRLKKESNED